MNNKENHIKAGLRNNQIIITFTRTDENKDKENELASQFFTAIENLINHLKEHIHQLNN